eukprot:4708851-Pyramimonas_sp.AAC.1
MALRWFLLFSPNRNSSEERPGTRSEKKGTPNIGARGGGGEGGGGEEQRGGGGGGGGGGGRGVEQCGGGSGGGRGLHRKASLGFPTAK